MPSLTVSSLVIANGTVHITYADKTGVMFSVDALEAFVLEQRAKLNDVMLAALIERAHNIDPTHGVAFRNAIIGKTITADPSKDQMLVRST